MAHISIDELEQAINIWRARFASDHYGSLCEPVRLLATPYALAIYERRTTIDISSLNGDQLEAIRDALGPGAV